MYNDIENISELCCILIVQKINFSELVQFELNMTITQWLVSLEMKWHKAVMMYFTFVTPFMNGVNELHPHFLAVPTF